MHWLRDSIRAFLAGWALTWSRHAIEQRFRRFGANVAVKAVHASLGMLLVQSVMVSGFLLANGGLLRMVFADTLRQVVQGVCMTPLGGIYFLVPPLLMWLWGGRLESWNQRLKVDNSGHSDHPAPRP